MINKFEIIVPEKNLGQTGQGNCVFNIKRAMDVVKDARNQEPAKRIFGDFAFENEITFIGGDTNTGKSILAVDIALAVAENKNNWGENIDCDVHGKVVIIDTELSDAQFARSYSQIIESENLYRASFWTDAYGRTSTAGTLEAIEQLFTFGNPPELIILDNLSTIVTLSSVKETQTFLQELKRIKNTYGCSLVIVSHTNKKAPTRPVEMDDFRGSKMVMNMADQVIALGNTKEGTDMKYLKILKTRNIRIPDTVSLLHISDDGNLHFEYEGEDYEMNLLPKPSRRGPSSSITMLQAERILEMNAQGVSIRGIAETMGISKSSVHRFLNSEKPDEML